MTFRQMLFGLFPPPHAFMEKAKVRQDMDNPETLALLAQVEGILGTYTAVRMYVYMYLLLYANFSDARNCALRCSDYFLCERFPGSMVQ